MNLKKTKGFLATALLLSLGVNAEAQDNPAYQSEGIVRITDGKATSASRPVSNPRIRQTSATANSPDVIPAGFHSSHFGGAGYGNYSGGYCPSGQCDPYCQDDGCHGCFTEHYCKVSPDYGYSPPAKYPLHRRGVEYTRYYPDKWYGAGGDTFPAAPMVYQPTDTTQLGFYYQHVPTWLPQPNRLPARPIPSEWHNTPPPVSPSGFCNGNGDCNSGYGDCFGSNCHSGRYGSGYGQGYGYGHGSGSGRRGWNNCDYGCDGDFVRQDSLLGRSRRLRLASRRRLGRFGQGDCSTACCVAPSCAATPSCVAAPSGAAAAPSCGVPTQCGSVAVPAATIGAAGPITPVTPEPRISPLPGVIPTPDAAPAVPVQLPANGGPNVNPQRIPAPTTVRSASFSNPFSRGNQRQAVIPSGFVPQATVAPDTQPLPQGYQIQPTATPVRGSVQPIGYTTQR